MKLAIDAMGGDHAPKAVIHGAMKAVKQRENLHITLFGDKQSINQYLTDDERISIVHTTEYITGEDEPVRAVRRKKNSSLVLMANMVKEVSADACLSAGNTGALMSAGLFIVGRNNRIERTALSSILPTLEELGIIILVVVATTYTI